jgi:putative DNA primase/helicase
MVVVAFNRHFTETEQDNTLKHQFSTDTAKSVILNWMLEGWRSLQAQGFRLPGSVVSAVEEYKTESDTITRFVEEQLEPDVNEEIRTTTLLGCYQNWARANGLDELNSNTFKGELTRAGMTVRRRRPKAGGNATSMLVGYKLRSPAGILSV